MTEEFIEEQEGSIEEVIVEDERDREEHNKQVKPVVKELYVILLDTKGPFIGEVTEINEIDKVVIIQNTTNAPNKEDGHIFLLDGDHLVLKSTKAQYTILDIERVIPFNLDILTKDSEQIQKQLTSDIVKELDISLEEIKQKDITYTDVELREELLSSLVSSFNAYDNLDLIKRINKTVTIYLELIHSTGHDDRYTYNLIPDKPLPRWIIPIVDNPLKLYTNNEDTDETYDDLVELYDNAIADDIEYYQLMHLLLDDNRPINPSLSDFGFNTTTHHGHYFRDCLQTDTCLGIQGNYKYDKRRNKSPFYLHYNKDKILVHQSDSLNIVGLLFVPDKYLLLSLNTLTNTTLQLGEKTILQYIIQHYYRRISQIKNTPILQKQFGPDFESSDTDSLVSVSIPERYTKEEFHEFLKQVVPSLEQIVSSIDKSITTILLNYEDLKLLLSKYEIDTTQLNETDKLYINTLISNNVTDYLSLVKLLPKIVLTIRKGVLTIQQKITVAYDIIMNMINIPRRNEYLRLFIEQYTRTATSKEDKNSLYNIYTNEKILCKHYLYISSYRDKTIFESMLSIYGKTPVDGSIYCKHCGEYLCNEEFSAFDGFDDETPVQLREVLQTDEHILNEYKEEQVLLVKEISQSLGVSIEDIDIKLTLDIHSSFNEDIIANTRYSMMNINESEEHPIMKDIMKKYKKEVNKKKLIQRDIKKFHAFLKGTNKVLGLTSILILLIQTSIPKYSFKNNFEFTFLGFKDSVSLGQLTYNKRVLDYSIVNIHKLSRKNEESFWIHYNELHNEHKAYDNLPTIKDQLFNLIQYLITPLYPIIQARIIDYGSFLQSTTLTYIRDEWPIFKPLRNNKLIKYIDEFVKVTSDSQLSPSEPEKHSDYFILNYNNYPVENVSLLSSINVSKDTTIRDYLKVPVSEIMVNKSFLLLFKVCVSNYGTSKGPVLSNQLHIQRFIDTIKHKDDISTIFDKYGRNPSYKILRTKIIPDIITYYEKSEQGLEECYSNSKTCNRFIHININNYELCLLGTKPKRIYTYIPPSVYPETSYEEFGDGLKKKIFNRYCKDPSGSIIKRTLNTNYLGKVILTLSDELDITLSDIIRDYEINLSQDSASFKDILTTLHTNAMPLSLYVKPVIYTIDHYNIDIYRRYIDVEARILQIFQRNLYYELGDDNPIIHNLTNYIDYMQSGNEIRDASIEQIGRDFDQSFSKLDTSDYINSIATFIYQSESKPHKKRFESIFINTTESINITPEERLELEKDDFRYKNLRERDIAKVLELFMADSRLTLDTTMSYLYHIKYILSKLSNVSTKSSNYIPKNWKLSDTSKTSLKDYIKTNSLYIHQDLFKKNPVYKGYLNYTETYLFSSIHEYIEPYMNIIYKLQHNHTSLVSDTISDILIRYIFMFLLDRIIEFYDKLKEEDAVVITLIETNMRKDNIDEDIDIELLTSVTETYIMDVLTDLLQMHYDSRWIVSNINTEDLLQRLSKQKEREKQTLIQRLDTMSDEKRASTVELQKMGVTNWFKTSAKDNEERIINEYTNAPDNERYASTNDAFSQDEVIENAMNSITGELSQVNEYNAFHQPQEESGYDENDIDDDGEPADEPPDFTDEGLLDNDFNE